MEVNATTFTIAEYCGQMQTGTIVINRDYQRTDKVWPPAARSYLIDTILMGYPIPKLSLYQKTDLKSRKTIKEIVDGQQRSRTIEDFYNGDLRISGPSEFAGKKFSDLDEPDKQRFVDYRLTADILVAAAESEIREIFRRMNSYTVPLNPEERRHATYQGAFKWFIVKITKQYAETLKKLGVFTEKNLSRMSDARFFTEIALALDSGIETYAYKKLDNYYREHDGGFGLQRDVERRMDDGFAHIVGLEEIHGGLLMKEGTFYTLMLAFMHRAKPVDSLSPLFRVSRGGIGSRDAVVANLSMLADYLEGSKAPVGAEEFVKACLEATNTKRHREERFRWFCQCLGRNLL